MKKKILLQILSTIILLACWDIITRNFNIREAVFPGPIAVISKLYPLLTEEELLKHFSVTLFECLLGFTCGFYLAVSFAIIVTHSKLFELLSEPPIVLLQSIPKIAIAPTVVSVFGLAMGPKIFLATLLSFFPVFISLVYGLKYVSPALLDIMKIYGANKRETLIWARVPNSLPTLFYGIKIALLASIVGVIIGEFWGAEAGGMGYLIIYSQAKPDTPAVFAELLFLGFMGRGFICLTRFIEKKVVYWLKEQGQEGGFLW